jgi:argininosuccinate synthase
MNGRITLAYSGSLASSAAVAWLLERHAAEVVTVTLDVGQTDDLDGVRSRALACGAIRAHVVDAREVFVREWVVPAMREPYGPVERLPDPLIARTLLEVASMEEADAVAHADSGTTLDALLAAAAPGRRIVAPAREWGMDADALAAYTRARGVPIGAVGRHRHLLLRDAIAPGRVAVVDAQLEIALSKGVPTSINGVEMMPAEAIDSLSLIAGQHGIGHGDRSPAPAAVVLRAAAAAAGNTDAIVGLILRPGAVEIASVTPLTHAELNAPVCR